MLAFFKTHMKDMVEVSIHGMPSVSGRVLRADESAVVLETEQGDVALSPNSVVLARAVSDRETPASYADTPPETESSLVVPNLNQRSGPAANIF